MESQYDKPRPDKKPNHLSHTTVTDDPANVDINRKSPGFRITRMRSGWAVHMPIRLFIDA